MPGEMEEWGIGFQKALLLKHSSPTLIDEAVLEPSEAADDDETGRYLIFGKQRSGDRITNACLMKTIMLTFSTRRIACDGVLTQEPQMDQVGAESVGVDEQRAVSEHNKLLTLLQR